MCIVRRQRSGLNAGSSNVLSSATYTHAYIYNSYHSIFAFSKINNLRIFLQRNRFKRDSLTKRILDNISLAGRKYWPHSEYSPWFGIQRGRLSINNLVHLHLDWYLSFLVAPLNCPTVERISSRWERREPVRKSRTQNIASDR